MNGWHLTKRVFNSYWLGGLAAGLLVICVSESIVSLQQRNQIDRQHIQVLNQLAILSARLEGEINSSLHLFRGVIANVAIHPEVDADEFDALASEILATGRSIRNIALAKDNVISHIFPLAGNEAALGLDYETQQDQWPTVREAMDKRSTVVAGPVDLVQGGRAFIARMPIYTRGGVGGHLSEHKPDYWGVASMVIDISALFASAGIEPETDGLLISLRGKDGKGARGEPIFGDATIFTADPVTLTVMLPNGSWQIGALPIGGWRGEGQMIWPLRIVGWLVALAIGILIAMLLRARGVNKALALHDHLTGLPNRRLLEDRFEQSMVRCQRNGGGFGVIYIDLDGFKSVNDRYGHRVGDGLLMEVAKRLVASIRQIDTVARIGGDEFIVLFEGIEDLAALRGLSETLQADLRGHAFVEEHKLRLHASLGEALYPDDGGSLDDLLRVADRKMYEQKRRGRVYDLALHQH